MRWVYVPDLVKNESNQPVSGHVANWFNGPETYGELEAKFPDLAPKCVAMPGGGPIGGDWLLVNGVFQEPPPSPPSYTTVTSYEFFQRWTKEERGVVRQMKAVNDDVADWYDLAVAAQVIEVDNPLTIAGVEQVLGGMLQMGFYPSEAAMNERKAQILAV